MGEAFATGFMRKLPQLSFMVHDAKMDRRDAAGRIRGLSVAASAEEVLQGSDITVLAVKPQDFAAFAAEMKGAGRGKSIISILAGRTIQAVADSLGTEQVARFMPTFAAVKGASMVGVSLHPGARRADAGGCSPARRCAGNGSGDPGKAHECHDRRLRIRPCFCISVRACHGPGGSGGGVRLPYGPRRCRGGPGGRREPPEGRRSSHGAGRAGSPHLPEPPSRACARWRKAGFTAAVMEAVEAAARKAADFEG